jgi:hypothetical protein
MNRLGNWRAGALAAGNLAAHGVAVDTSWVYAGVAGAVFDLDFVNRRYYWGGVARLGETDFSAAGTGMTWDSHGMTAGAAGYLRQTLAALGMTDADTAGTIVSSVYVVTAALTGNDYVWSASDGTFNEQTYLIHNTVPNLVLNIVDDGVAKVSATTGAVNDTKMAKGIAWTLNDTDTCVNTDAVVPDNVCTMPTIAAAGHLTIGARYDTAAPWEVGAIGRLIGYNLKLSDADLQTVTSYLYGWQP